MRISFELGRGGGGGGLTTSRSPVWIHLRCCIGAAVSTALVSNPPAAVVSPQLHQLSFESLKPKLVPTPRLRLTSGNLFQGLKMVARVYVSVKAAEQVWNMAPLALANEQKP